MRGRHQIDVAAAGAAGRRPKAQPAPDMTAPSVTTKPLDSLADSGNGSDLRPLLLTPQQAAELLAIGRTTLYGLLKAGLIASVHIGGSRRIPYEAIRQYVACLMDTNANDDRNSDDSHDKEGTSSHTDSTLKHDPRHYGGLEALKLPLFDNEPADSPNPAGHDGSPTAAGRPGE